MCTIPGKWPYHCGMNNPLPTLIFGAFDRHNFGDLLFPHIVAAMLPGRELIYAGLAERDLRPCGGHQVRALATLADELRDQPVNIIHAGGELLTCEAWQAAVMLQAPEQAQALVARLDELPKERTQWAQQFLAVNDAAPYTVARQLFPDAASVCFNAVGGADLDARAPELRDEVLEKLRAADAVSVRDRVTLTHLQEAGVIARLSPDPAVMVAELFGARIGERAQQGEVASLLSGYPQGYVAVQFSADMGDDETLEDIADQLQQIADVTGRAIVLFRAGAAPWHDDIACYRRLTNRLSHGAVHIFNSLALWDICALLAHSVAYCGTSLHGRIVANAFGVPALNLHNPRSASEKQLQYALSWPSPALPPLVDAKELAEKVVAVLAVEREELRVAAADLAALYRRRFVALAAALR